MKIADLRHRIAILDSDGSKTDLGGRQKTYSEKFSCFAGVKVEDGEEQAENDRITRNLTITFTIRYRPDVKSYQRVKYDGKIFRINNLYPDALKTKLTLECEEVI